MMDYYELQPLRFSCTRCGRCCETAGDYYVFLTEEEAERIRIRLQLSVRWFRRRYLGRLDSGELVLASSPDGRCIFLDDRGECRIYTVRPLQCRTYPFWPELVCSKRGWQQESLRCEGINHGAEVPLSRIRRALKSVRSASGE